MFLVLVNDNEGGLTELVHVGCDRKVAEQKFLDTCADNDFDIVEDKERFLDEGYASWGGGAVMLIDTDGFPIAGETISIRDSLEPTICPSCNKPMKADDNDGVFSCFDCDYSSCEHCGHNGPSPE